MKNHEFSELVNDLRDVPNVQCKRAIISRILTGAGIKPDGNENALPLLKHQGGWISCSERTPEPLDWVIAYDEVGTVKAYICPHTKEWVRDNGDELYRVTHWQLLPAPPNAQTNGDDCRESGMEQTNNGSAK